MIRYILKRLLWMIPILLGVSIVVFWLTDLVPVDPATSILGTAATKESIEALNHQLGYDLPFGQRYLNYMIDVLFHFDFGTSYITKTPVLNELITRVPISAKVAFGAIVVAVFIGVPIGILSAVKQYSILDAVSSAIAMVLAAAPAFVIGMLLLLEFSLKRGWLPAYFAAGADAYVLPILTLGLVYGATMMRFTRSSMLETIRQDYIRTARAKGIQERKVIMGHALTNALLPVITAAGNTFAALLGGAVVTETLFSIPGLGTFVVNAVKQKDVPVVMGGTICIALLVSIVILTVDIIYAYVDPRIKAKYAKEAK